MSAMTVQGQQAQPQQQHALSRMSPEVEQAALKAAGFDRVDPATRMVVVEIARTYKLELMLRHLLPIDGKPYITRDGLLHVAHMSGQLDGIVLEDQGDIDGGGGWYAVISVYRKDMKHPFKFRGRYNGQNKKYGPEMAVKTAECMALRRAFDVSLCSTEERESERVDGGGDPSAGWTASREAQAPVAATSPATVEPPARPRCSESVLNAVKAHAKAAGLGTPGALRLELPKILGRPATLNDIDEKEAALVVAELRRHAASPRTVTVVTPPAAAAPKPAPKTTATKAPKDEDGDNHYDPTADDGDDKYDLRGDPGEEGDAGAGDGGSGGAGGNVDGGDIGGRA